MPSMFSGPLFSIILTILAGIALRYALWYGKDEEPVFVDDGEAQSLRERNQRLQEALEQEQSRRASLSEDHQRAIAELNGLKTTYADRENTFSVAQQSSEQLRTEVGTLRACVMRFESETERLQSECGQLQSECGQLHENIRQLELERDQIKAEQDELRTDQSKEDQTAQLLRTQNDELQCVVDELRTQLTSEQDASQELAGRLHEISAERDQMAADRDEMIAERDHHIAVQHENDRERDRINEDLTSEQQLRTEAELALNEANDQIAMLSAEARFAANLRREQGQLKTSLHESAQRLRSIHEERESMAATITESETRIAQLQDTVENQSTRMKQYAAELESLGHRADERVAEIEATYKSQIHELRSQHEDFVAQVSERDSEVARQLSEAETLVGGMEELRIERDDLVSQLSIARQQVDQVETKLSELEHNASSFDDTLRAVQTEKQELLNGIYREQETVAQLRDALQESQHEAATNKVESDERTLLRDRCTELELLLNETTQKSNELEIERDELNGSLIHAQRRVTELGGSVNRFEQELNSRENAIRKLTLEKDNVATQLERERRERNRLESMLRVHTETLDQLRVDSQSLESLLERQTVVQHSLQEHAERLRSVTGKYPEGVVDPQILSMIDYETPTSDVNAVRRDDLKRISGIGEVLEQKLNDQGVWTYEQIMVWNEAAIEEFSRTLAWDRIEADNWVAQAKQLSDDAQSRSHAA